MSHAYIVVEARRQEEFKVMIACNQQADAVDKVVDVRAPSSAAQMQLAILVNVRGWHWGLGVPKSTDACLISAEG